MTNFSSGVTGEYAPPITNLATKEQSLSVHLGHVWALLSPFLALWMGDALVLSQQDWSMTTSYCALSFGFAVVAFVAFRLQDTMTRNFSAHEVLDIIEAVLFAELMTYGLLFTLTRLDGIPRTVPLYHGLLLAGGLIFARILNAVRKRGGGRDQLSGTP